MDTYVEECYIEDKINDFCSFIRVSGFKDYKEVIALYGIYERIYRGRFVIQLGWITKK